jgi:Flp pilus assembly protein TadG
LILPVLLFLFLLTVDIGRLFYTDVSVANASREGAAYAITNATDAADNTAIAAHAQNEFSGVNNSRDLTVSVVCAPSCTKGNTVRVTVKTRFVFLFPLFAPDIWISDSATGIIQ